LADVFEVFRSQGEQLRQRIYEEATDLPDDVIPGLEKLGVDHSTPRGIYANMMVNSFTFSDLGFSELVRKKFKFGSGMLLSEHLLLVNTMSKLGIQPENFPHRTGNTTKVVGPSILDDITLPDFGGFSWDVIFDLRSDRFIKFFRREIAEIMAFTRTAQPREIKLGEAIERSIWRHFEEDQPPRISTTLGKAALSVVHVPSFEWVSPMLHGALAAAELLEASDRKRNSGWLYFLANARKRQIEAQIGGPDGKES
jgi:hypothetical protein